MTDVRIKNGDVVKNSRGMYEKINGAKARIQSALISMRVDKGSFVYDRTIGSCKNKVNMADEDALGRLELVLNEALVEYKDTNVEVLEIGKKVRLRIKSGDTIIEEVL